MLQRRRAGGVSAWVFFEPFVYQEMSLQFCSLAWPDNDLTGHFNAPRMNSDRPLLSLDPNADRIPYASVLHRGSLNRI